MAKARPDTKNRSGLKTREVLLAAGITHQVLYRYVTLGLIEEARVTSSGQRLFHASTIPAIRLIQRLNQSGYTLRDIKEIFFKEERLRKLRRSSEPKAEPK
jgi:DNA-binding transcriptional MerR regulator